MRRTVRIACTVTLLALAAVSCDKRNETDHRDKWCGEWDLTCHFKSAESSDTTYYTGTISKCGSDSIRIRFSEGSCDCFDIPTPSPLCDYVDFLTFAGTDTLILNDVRYQIPQWNYYTSYNGVLTPDSLYLKWGFKSTSDISEYAVMNGAGYTLSGSKIK